MTNEIYRTAREDLTVVVAQMTAGVTGIQPEQEDYEIAGEIELIINEKIREYYNT